MFDVAEIAERQGRILAELSELGMTLARDLHADATAAETPEQRAELSLAFQRTARSVRQTLALELRLVRDLRRCQQEERADVVREQEQRVARRRKQAQAAVERAIWTEYDWDEQDDLIDTLKSLLDEDQLADGFADGPLESYVLRLRADLGIRSRRDREAQAAAPAAGEGAPSPKGEVPSGPPDDEPRFDAAEPPTRWRSSG